MPPGFSLNFIDRIATGLNAQRDLPDKAGTINLKLVSDAEISALNEQFAGINTPTDVLSFPYSGEDELGDVAISLETAERQAESAGVKLEDELGTLLVHGLLHILGFDHQTASEQALMDKHQTAILKAAGLNYRKLDYK